MLPPADDDSGLELLGAGLGLQPSSTTSSSVVETGGVRSGRLALAVGGVAAAVAVVWGLTQLPIAQETRDRDGEETASIDEASVDGDDAGDREADDPTVPSERTTTRADTTTSTVDRASSAEAEPTTTEAAGPVVGEETGLLVVFFSFEGGFYQVVDLDTGAHRKVADRQGEPTGVIGSSVVINGSRGPVLLDLSEEDPERQQLDIDQDWAHVVTVQGERMWVVDEYEDARLVAYDRTGARVDEVDMPVSWWWQRQQIGPAVRPNEFFYDPAGGLYRYRADGTILRLTEAAPIALGERMGLVRACDAGFECDHAWMDLVTGAALDVPVPGLLSPDGLTVILGSDRWLLHTEWTGGQTNLIEVVTGEVRRQVFADQGWFYAGVSMGPVSDDGRWLLDTIAGQHVIIDLDSDEVHELGLSGSFGVTGFFVDADS